MAPLHLIRSPWRLSRARSPIMPPFVPAVSDKDEESEDMSIPGSPQNEAIQHSSISTSNGVGSASATPAVPAPSSGATTSNQSTEESQLRRDMAQAQPPGSWWSWSRAGRRFLCALVTSEGRDWLSASVWTTCLLFIFDELVAFENIFSVINEDKRTGTLGVRCKNPCFCIMWLIYCCDVLICCRPKCAVSTFLACFYFVFTMKLETEESLYVVVLCGFCTFWEMTGLPS